MFSLKQLYEWNTRTLKDGEWIPARPLVGPLWWRIKDAWAVLRGRADAFKWPNGQ